MAAVPRSLLFYQVDAFSSVPFGGNPAAVILLNSEADVSDEERQKIAAENNLAETAFVAPLRSDSDGSEVPAPFTSSGHFSLRWFTPTTEVPLCGHATLAAAAVLFKEHGNVFSVVRFHTLSGVLEVTKGLEMGLPLAVPSDPVPEGCEDPEGSLAMACTGGLEVSEVLYAATAGLKYLLLRLGDGVTRQQLEAIQPDMAAMQAAASADDVRGVILTMPGEGSGSSGSGGRHYDFLSRFFAPWMGIPEDHVTGSAHAVLAPYWQARLPPPSSAESGAASAGGHGVPSSSASSRTSMDQSSSEGGSEGLGASSSKASPVAAAGASSGVGMPTSSGPGHAARSPSSVYIALTGASSPAGRQTMVARQCSPRGGDITVRVEAGSSRVVVSGQAVVVIRGALHL